MIGAFKAQMVGADGIAAPLRHATFRRIWLASVLSNLGILIQGVGANHPGLERADHIWAPAPSALLCDAKAAGLIVTRHRFTARHIFCEAAIC